MAEFMKYFRAAVMTALLGWGVSLEAENAASEVTLSEINQSMRKMSTFSARFKQVKQFRILTSHIVLDGSIYISRSPFKLAWRIEKPMRYTVIMDENRLWQWDEETTHTKEYKFNDNPVLKMVSQTYHELMLGDFTRIAGECDIAIDSSSHAIKVTPRAKSNMSKAISQITFRFNENFRYLVHIAIAEPGGNSTTIDFSGIKINEPISEKAWIHGNDS